MPIRRVLYIITILFGTALYGETSASNVKITTPQPVELEQKGRCLLRTSLSWESSWRLGRPNNWDAVWVFAKYSEAGGIWQPLYFDRTDSLYRAVGTSKNERIALNCDLGLSVDPEGDTVGMGVFVYRAGQGTGDLSVDTLDLCWNYAAAGLESFASLSSVSLRIFAIEMVYVPDDPYFLGDGLSSASRLCVQGHRIGYASLLLNNATLGGASTIDRVPEGDLYYFNSATDSLLLPPDYPRGRRPFYIMKYELSQAGYVDFLNTLNYNQQCLRSNLLPYRLSSWFYNDAATRPSYRNYIVLRERGTVSAAVYGLWADPGFADHWKPELNGGNIGMNMLSWEDVSAYLVWAGLRPLTELEYEKTCRGPLLPVEGEFAWGSTVCRLVSDQVSQIQQPYLPNEAISMGNNLIPYYNNQQCYPMRVGCLAFPGSSREESGSAFYGVLNLSDHLAEAYVNVTSPEGRNFRAEHGHGRIDVASFMPTWPENMGSGVGFRGYYCTYNNPQLGYDLHTAQLSDRTHMNLNFRTRNLQMGCRGGRTAPEPANEKKE